jgi:predicted nucleic acid-binding Zn ribbon protein
MIPFYNQTEYKTPVYWYNGERIGTQKVTIQAFVDGEKTILREERFLAVLEKYAPKKARIFKGFGHYRLSQYVTPERVYQMALFLSQLPDLCKECGQGFQVLQRPGKYGCTNCEA